jgi:sugar phosphate isomerase/epimerase
MKKLKVKILLSLTLFSIVLCLMLTEIKAQNKSKRLTRIGVQLYTVRKEMEKDFEGTLRRIARLGFTEVEFAGLFGKDPKKIRQLLKELKMRAVASHIDWQRLKNDPAGAIRETKELGAKYMVLAWFPPAERKTLEQWNDWVKLLNRVGKMSFQQGIKLLYHNHEFEFVPIEGIRPFDILLKDVDRRYVGFEIDIYWLMLAGEDIFSLFSRYPKGFPLVHIKDMSKTKKEMVDVGDGKINFGEIFAQQKKSGTKHFFVEHDNSENPFKTLERSFEYLRKLRY